MRPPKLVAAVMHQENATRGCNTIILARYQIDGSSISPRPTLPLQAVVLGGFGIVIQGPLTTYQKVTRADTCTFRPGALTPEAKVR